MSGNGEENNVYEGKVEAPVMDTAGSSSPLPAVRPSAAWAAEVDALRSALEATRQDLVLARGAMRAADERLAAAAMRVWGDHTHGADAPEWLADEVLWLTGEVTRLRAGFSPRPPRNTRAEPPDGDFAACPQPEAMRLLGEAVLRRRLAALAWEKEPPGSPGKVAAWGEQIKAADEVEERLASLGAD